MSDCGYGDGMNVRLTQYEYCYRPAGYFDTAGSSVETVPIWHPVSPPCEETGLQLFRRPLSTDRE